MGCLRGGGGGQAKTQTKKVHVKNIDTAGTSRKKVMQALINIYLIH